MKDEEEEEVVISWRMPGYDTMINEPESAAGSGSGSGRPGHNANLAAPGEQPGNAYAYRQWCGVRRSTWFLTLYTATYVAFLALGGYAMRLMEQEHVNQLTRDARRGKAQFLQKYPQVKYEDLESLLESFQSYQADGISVLDADDKRENWSFGQSVLFTVTVVTTIGYGHVTPLTSSGKLFTIVYALLGIPFTLVFITASVQRLLEPTCSVLAYFFARFGGRIAPFYIRLWHLCFMTFLLVLFFIVLPSLAFYLIESDWTFLDGFYFVFISLTTIGLGDYIPGDNQKQGGFKDVYKVVVAAYLLLGLVFITLGATVFYDIPQLNLGTILHQQKDLHIPSSKTNSTVGDEEVAERTKDNERSKLKDSFKKVIGHNHGD